MNQRWELGRHRWRPAGEVIRTWEYETSAVSREKAESFVALHHYARTSPAGRFWYGLHRGGRLVGAAIFSQPCNNRAITKVFPIDFRDGVELGRLVLLDEVPGNGESWFVARCFAELRRAGIAAAVSFSDPLRRVAEDGRVILPGHVGTVYQALSACYLGRADGRILRLFPDGTVFNHRTETKIAARDTGHEGAVRQLVGRGARPPSDGEDLGRWAKSEITRLTRPLRHLGCHKYAWAIDRALRADLPAQRPYPKALDIA